MEFMPQEKRILQEAPPPLLEWKEIRNGSLAVHVTGSSEEIEAAQALRYQIFYEEMGGTPSAEVKALKRDFDIFDSVCDHLLVLDYDLPRSTGQVVGTYRMLRRSAMKKLGRFYSEGEFDIGALKQEQGEILELGRSCVDPRYRNRSVMQLLWRGIASYVSLHDIKLMFGCASLPGIDVDSHSLALSYLHHFHMAPTSLCALALPDQYVEMNRMPKEAIDVKEAFSALPALIKGYLRLGGYIGQGAVIDRQCNTTDVGIVVKTELVTEKYAQRYSTPTARGNE
jgi:putative hemolysin